jgi:hypothetical protein
MGQKMNGAYPGDQEGRNNRSVNIKVYQVRNGQIN